MTTGPEIEESQVILSTLGARARSWMFAAAFPLWCASGRDHDHGGFHERLTFAAQPTGDPRRAFVQARQAYSFCEAGRMGWTADWAAAAQAAIDYLLSSFVATNGAVVHKVDARGQTIDARVTLYDCAFTIFALAHVHQTCGRGNRERRAAERVLGFLKRERAHPAGGFFDRPDGQLSQNPHMHLLEAALAWIELGGDDRWWSLAEDLVAAAARYFVDPVTGAVREDFAADWSPLPARIEPGHQYEWAYLLSRWTRIAKSACAVSSERLFFLAEERGLDRRRGVAISALDADLRQTDTSARLWAQTERLRAALALAPGLPPDRREIALAAAAEAVVAIERFLDTPVRGLWRDDWRAVGEFADNAVRASSLYHLVSGYRALDVHLEHAR